MTSKESDLVDRLRLVVAEIGTQTKAAAVAGVSLATLQNYLSGRHAPGLLPVARIAEEASVNLGWIVYGEGPKHGATLGPPATVANVRRILTFIRDLEPSLLRTYKEAGIELTERELSNCFEELASLFDAVEQQEGEPLRASRAVWRLLSDAYLLAHKSALLVTASKVAKRPASRAKHK